MSFAMDDPTPFLVPPPSGQGLNFGTGLVTAWDNTTGENQVEYRGLTLVNLPILNATDVLVIAPGDVVSILSWHPGGRGLGSYFILGRFVTPPLSASAASFLQTSLGRQIAAEVFADRVKIDSDDSTVSTSSSSYVQLSGGPEVANIEISDSGVAIIGVQALIVIVNSESNSRTGLMSYSISGATSKSASDSDAYLVQNTHDNLSNVDSISVRAMAFTVETGLNPGEHTFTAEYRAIVSSNSVGFANRRLMVIGL